MQIIENCLGGHLVLLPEGRLDSINTPYLERALSDAIERGDINVVVDFSALEYISSMGLSVLLSAAKKIKKMEGRIALSAMNDRISSVMEISGFNNIFLIFPSTELALKDARSTA